MIAENNYLIPEDAK